LNCYDEWIQSKISEEEFIAVFQILENFILRRFVCDVQTRGLNRIFALLHSQITKDPNITSGSFVERLKIALQSKDYPKDSLFKERLLDVKLYGSNRTEKAKLILESLEESFKHKEKVDLAKVSIEHIMPQTPNDWWKEHLGEDWSITYDLFVGQPHTFLNKRVDIS
jgi:ubiquitin C-terminal hydrolase